MRQHLLHYNPNLGSGLGNYDGVNDTGIIQIRLGHNNESLLERRRRIYFTVVWLKQSNRVLDSIVGITSTCDKDFKRAQSSLNRT